MKEYKFRAWDGKNMYDRVLPFTWDFVLNAMAHKCIKSNGVGLLGSGGDYATFEIDGYRFKEIMQFTGLKDKNGKEIYEGDICRTYELGVGNLKRVVVFDRGSFCIRHDYGLIEELRGWNKDYIEVLGNIHQNPELL